MVHSVGTARDSSSDGIMHSGGAGWRDSARLEARVGATRDGAGVADEHSRGAGWRDSARPEARVSASRDGADVEGQCGPAELHRAAMATCNDLQLTWSLTEQGETDSSRARCLSPSMRRNSARVSKSDDCVGVIVEYNTDVRVRDRGNRCESRPIP